MNELQIFDNEDFAKIKEIENSNKGKYTGFFYVLEYGDFVKIGRLAISIPHTNYVENEKHLHEYFKDKRKRGSELFDCALEEIIPDILTVAEYRDDSEKINAKADMFFQGMKRFVMGGANL